MKEISEAEMLEAIKYAHEEIKVQIRSTRKISSENSCISNQREYSHETHNEEIREKVWAECYDKVYNVAKLLLQKEERHEKFAAVLEEFLSQYSEEERADVEPFAKIYYHDVEKRSNASNDSKRRNQIRW